MVHMKARNLPERLNILVDLMSRKWALVQTEWYLNQRVASLFFHICVMPHIDLFATHESETSDAHIPSSGTGCVCNRCTESELAGNVGICISTISTNSNLTKDNCGRGMSSVSDCSSVGRTSTVSSASEAAGGSCSLSLMEEGSTVPINIQNVASHSSSVLSSRLVAMQQRMEASGISESVTRRIYSAKRPSTNNMYDYRWKSWLD